MAAFQPGFWLRARHRDFSDPERPATHPVLAAHLHGGSHFAIIMVELLVEDFEAAYPIPAERPVCLALANRLLIR